MTNSPTTTAPRNEDFNGIPNLWDFNCKNMFFRAVGSLSEKAVAAANATANTVAPITKGIFEMVTSRSFTLGALGGTAFVAGCLKLANTSFGRLSGAGKAELIGFIILIGARCYSYATSQNGWEQKCDSARSLIKLANDRAGIELAAVKKTLQYKNESLSENQKTNYQARLDDIEAAMTANCKAFDTYKNTPGSLEHHKNLEELHCKFGKIAVDLSTLHVDILRTALTSSALTPEQLSALENAPKK